MRVEQALPLVIAVVIVIVVGFYLHWKIPITITTTTAITMNTAKLIAFPLRLSADPPCSLCKKGGAQIQHQTIRKQDSINRFDGSNISNRFQSRSQ